MVERMATRWKKARRLRVTERPTLDEASWLVLWTMG